MQLHGYGMSFLFPAGDMSFCSAWSTAALAGDLQLLQELHGVHGVHGVHGSLGWRSPTPARAVMVQELRQRADALTSPLLACMHCHDDTGGAAAASARDLPLREPCTRPVGHGPGAAAADAPHLLKHGGLSLSDMAERTCPDRTCHSQRRGRSAKGGGRGYIYKGGRSAKWGGRGEK